MSELLRNLYREQERAFFTHERTKNSRSTAYKPKNKRFQRVSGLPYAVGFRLILADCTQKQGRIYTPIFYRAKVSTIPKNMIIGIDRQSLEISTLSTVYHSNGGKNTRSVFFLLYI